MVSRSYVINSNKLMSIKNAQLLILIFVFMVGYIELKAGDSISILKDCGEDQRCIPDLSIEYNLISGTYVVGNGETIELEATIQNIGEDALNARFYLQTPFNLQRISFIRAINSNTYDSLLCDMPPANNNNTLRCDIGNLLPMNSDVEIKIYLQPGEKNQDVYNSGFELKMIVNSSNPEESSWNQKNNEVTFIVPVEVIPDISITGKSDPPVLHYNSTAGYASTYLVEDQIGHPVVHMYILKNNGPSTMQDAEIYILWPSFTGDKWGGTHDHLLYLLGVDYDNSKVTCQPIKNINPLYVKTSGLPGYAKAYAASIAKYEFNRMYNSDDINTGGNGSRKTSSSSDNLPSSRTKRTTVNFKDEIKCEPGKCTLVQCKVGQLKKDEFLTFKIRSRLFTETQIKKFRKRVEISSKMVTRITRLSYQSNRRTVKLQVGRVTTEVSPVEALISKMATRIRQLPYKTSPRTVESQDGRETTGVSPSDMYEASIPWWARLWVWWLVAGVALGSLLLLVAIIFCLYKCCIYKSKRPDYSPEILPLNGNGSNPLL